MKRRRFTPLNATQCSPTWDRMLNREPSRRQFETLQSVGGGALREPLQALCGRLIYNGAPLNSDATLDADGYTREWDTATSFPVPNSHAIVITAADVAAGYHYTTGTPGVNFAQWLTWKLKPYRLKLGMDLGVSTSLFYRPHGEYHLEQYNLTSWGLVPVNLRNTGPPEEGHAGRVVTTQPEYFSTLIFDRDQTAIKSPINVASWSWTANLKYVRYIVDGVDVTGPLSVSQSINTAIAHGGFSAYGRLTAGSVTIPNGIDVTDATLEIDLWHEITVGGTAAGTLDGSGPGGSIWNGGGTAEGWNVCTMADRTWYAWTGEVYPRIGRVMFSGGNVHRRIKKNHVFELEFDRQGPAGLTTFRLESQTGWTGTDTYDGLVKLTHAATGDFVEFAYAQEVPCLLIAKPAANNSPSGYIGQVRYHPVDSGHYDALPLNPNPATQREPIRGVWNPKVPTVFRLAGRQQSSPLNLTMDPIGETGSARDKDSSYYDDFPYEITVTVIT